MTNACKTPRRLPADSEKQLNEELGCDANLVIFSKRSKKSGIKEVILARNLCRQYEAVDALDAWERHNQTRDGPNRTPPSLQQYGRKKVEEAEKYAIDYGEQMLKEDPAIRNNPIIKVPARILKDVIEQKIRGEGLDARMMGMRYEYSLPAIQALTAKPYACCSLLWR